MTAPRIIFVSADLQKGLGDWVMSLPAAKLVREAWGEYAELVCICPEPLQALADLAGVFDRIHPYTLDWCERYGADLMHALCLVALMDSDLFVHDEVVRRLEKYDIRQGIYRNRHWRIQQHHSLMLARNLDLLVGYDPAEPLKHPLTHWTPAAGKFIALHAGRGPLWRKGAKDWPYFFHLAKLLQGAGWEPVQIIGPADTPLEGIPAWQGSVTELAHMLLDCQAFVGNDSGPGHLAGSLGLPTHIIFGVTDPELWRPVGPRVTWSRAATGKPEDVTANEVYQSVLGKLAAYQRAVA